MGECNSSEPTRICRDLVRPPSRFDGGNQNTKTAHPGLAGLWVAESGFRLAFRRHMGTGDCILCKAFRLLGRSRPCGLLVILSINMQ